MSTPYVGEIRPWAATFAPIGWSFCDGSLQSIANNEVLYTLLGTMYGGDGVTTFGLPDLRGRVPIHFGAGFVQGQNAGEADVTLVPSQLPTHTHPWVTTAKAGTTQKPAAALMADLGPGSITTVFSYTNYTGANQVNLASGQITTAGQSASHTNLQPYQAINFIIALQGVFPQQG